MVLFENFNTSNQTNPIALPHLQFVIDIDEKGCQLVQEKKFSERCNFVENTEDCHGDEFVNYLHLLYCTLKPDSNVEMYSCVLLLLCFCMVMFMVMGTCADKFFVPSLTILSNIIGLSENVAGVTILAFGNGSPDLFTSFSTINADSSMLYSELIGAATFIVTVIAGSIILIKPFKIFAPHFLRDALFFVAALQLIDYAMFTRRSVSFVECIALILFYIIYLFVVIIDQILANRIAHGAGGEKYKGQATLDFVPRRSQGSVDLKEFAMASFTATSANTNLFPQFFKSLNPIDSDDWEESGIIMKVFIIIKIPVALTLNILLPVVDYEVAVHGWSKLLDCLHIMTIPVLFGAIATQATIYNIPFFVWVIFATFPIALLVFLTSRTDRPPKYHLIYTIIAIVGSVLVIWLSATEVVHILETVGIVSKLTISFLGCTVLAWGNSVGDLISNISLARQGYQKMGFAGCYGGPLFNSLMGIGITFLAKCLQTEEWVAPVRRGYLAENYSAFLAIALCFVVLALSFTNFLARRSIGIFMLMLYSIIFIYVLFSELELIHAFGADH